MDFETRRAVPRIAVPEPPKPQPQFAVGDECSVYSASSGGWMRARVVRSESGTVTVSYRLADGGEAQKQLMIDSENLRPA